MKKFKVKKGQYSQLLAGKPEKGSSCKRNTLIAGMNCVYEDLHSDKEYRVALRTTDGWKNYGKFNNLGTAAYVANIAILTTENTQFEYELNEISGKDSDELCEWRKHPESQELESLARAKHNNRMKEREEEEKWKEEQEFNILKSLSSKELLILIEKRRSLGMEWKIARKLYDSRKKGS